MPARPASSCPGPLTLRVQSPSSSRPRGARASRLTSLSHSLPLPLGHRRLQKHRQRPSSLASAPVQCPPGTAAESASERRPQCPCCPLCRAPARSLARAQQPPSRCVASLQRWPCVQGFQPSAGPPRPQPSPPQGTSHARFPQLAWARSDRDLSPYPRSSPPGGEHQPRDRMCVPSPTGPGAAPHSNVPHGGHGGH